MAKIICVLKNFFSSEKTEEIISFFIIFLLAAVAVFFILYRADWLLGDNFPFLLTTAKGKFYPLVTVFKVGETRFFPFAFLDFNLLPLIPGAISGFAHYIYVAFSYIVFCLFFVLSCKIICRETGIKYMLYFSAAALVTAELHSGFFDSFMNIMFPERVVIVLFTVFAFLMFKYNENKKTYLLVLAFISAFIATYFKETVFAFFIVYAGWTLLFKKDCNRKEKIFSYTLIVNGIVFLLLYYIFAWKGHSSVYGKDSVLGIWQLMDTVFRNSALLLFIFPFTAVRLFKCLVLKQESIPVIDPLLAAAAVYALEYLVLGYSSGYYYAPALTAGALPVVYLSFRMCEKHGYARPAVILLLCLVPFVEIPSVSACINSTVIERTKVMPGLRKISALQQKGGKIYWYNPAEDLEITYSLLNIYINYIQGTEDIDFITRISDMTELKKNDVFLYTLDSSTLKLHTDARILRLIEQQKFRFFQYQTGFLVFMHEDNLKEAENTES